MRNLFSFRGRTDRKTFALAFVVAALASVPLRIGLDLAIHAVDASFTLQHVPVALRAVTLPSGAATGVIVVAVGIILCGAVAAVAFLVRRFHDMGLTGWLVLPAFVLAALVPEVEMPTGVLPPLGTIIWAVLMALVPGTRGANRYGPPPGSSGEDQEADGSAFPRPSQSQAP